MSENAKLKNGGVQSHKDGTAQMGDKENADIDRIYCDNQFKIGEGSWRLILKEEVSEALAEKDLDKLRTELIQVAAVAVSWVEDIDKRIAQKPIITEAEVYNIIGLKDSDKYREEILWRKFKDIIDNKTSVIPDDVKMKEIERQTGRTTRKIVKAITSVLNGHNVAVITMNAMHKEMFQAKYSTYMQAVIFKLNKPFGTKYGKIQFTTQASTKSELLGYKYDVLIVDLD